MNLHPELMEETSCEECGGSVYHFHLEPHDITYRPDEGFVLHLDEEEVQNLYMILKGIVIHGERK